MRSTALAACVAAAVLLGGGHGTTGAPAGGTMANVSVKRLGDVQPGVERGGSNAPGHVDASPIVLWAGDSPAAVLAYEVKSAPMLLSAAQRFGRIDGDPHAHGGGPFPVTYSARMGAVKSEASLDLVDPGHAIAADVNGDGTDELVLVRQLGAIEVFSTKARLFQFPGAVTGVKGTCYAPVASHVARLAGRAVVHVLFNLKVLEGVDPTTFEKPGAPDRFAVVRVDKSGIQRIQLEGVGGPGIDVIALGALSHAGSDEVDELLACSIRADDERVYLSRHRPDGRAIGPPREIYVPFPHYRDVTFELVARSGRAIAFSRDKKRVYFFAPEKPVNWVRSVDLAPAAGADHIAPLPAIVDAVGPKAIFAAKDRLFAVDEAGRYHVVRGGAWVAVRGAEPFYRATAPSPQHRLVGVMAGDRNDQLFAYTRKSQGREFTHEELVTAGERFLPARDLERLRREREPSLDRRDFVRDELMEKERKAKNVTAKIATIDDWKRLLPDSYAKVVQIHRAEFDSSVRTLLLMPVESGGSTREYRDPEGHRRWLGDAVVSAESTLVLVRNGARAFEVKVPGYHDVSVSSDLGVGDVQFRARGDSMSAVMRLQSSGDTPGFFLVRRVSDR